MPKKGKMSRAAKKREGTKSDGVKSSSLEKEPVFVTNDKKDGKKHQIKPSVSSIVQENFRFKCIRGSTHQGDISVFSNAGLQCSYISLVSLIKMDTVKPNFWTTYDIDDTLVTGDAMFAQHFKSKEYSPRMLSAVELPEEIRVFNADYTIKKDKEICGIVCNKIADDVVLNDVGGVTLNVAVGRLFAHHTYGLFFCGSHIVSISALEGSYYIFDSHSRDNQGLMSSDGKAVLIEFKKLDHLLHHLKKLFIVSLKKENEQFEIVPVSIQKQRAVFSNESQMHLYLEDQMKKRTTYKINESSLKHEKDNRRNYMKEYKAKQRKHFDYRKNENLENRNRIKKFRTKTEFVKKETTKNKERIQNLRSDPQYLQDERANDAVRKKRKREDENFREHERLAKQQKRIDTTVKDRKNRAISKKRKRQSQKYLENEAKKRFERNNGSSLDTYIKVFENSIAETATYVCSCCHQLWCKESVKDKTTLLAKCGDSASKYLTGKLSVENKEWICNTCSSCINKGSIPKLAVKNGMAFAEKPPELDLTNLEERLIALRIPFMQIRSLASGGQYQLRGSVVNVPAQIEPTIRALPRNLDESGIIPVRLKRMLKMKNADQTENVRPAAVHAALKSLLETSDLYKDSEVNIDINWTGTEFTKEKSADCDEPSDCDSSDNFSEVDECESNQVVTLLDEPEEKKNYVVSVAPGEGQRPISLYKDPDAEYLAFPTIFCGKRRVSNSEREKKVYYSDICKWELRSCDRRVALHVPNIFFKMKKLQCQQVCNKVNLAIRRCKTQGKSYTAGYILKDNMGDSLVKLDEGYRIFRSVRNSPQYWEWKRKEIFAMIRQLGIPTLFLSLSANDLHWPELIKALGILVDKKDYSEDIETKSLTWETRTRLVRSDPVTCVRHFDHRVRQYLNLLKGPCSPLGMMKDFFYRVEFQQRGSPHIHLLGWIEGAPVYNGENEKEICEFIDNIASCTSDVNENEKPFLEFQMHKHSRTCRKRGSPVCRFGVPFPAMSETRVIHPYDGPDRKKYEDMYKDIQKALNSLEGDVTYEQFLESLGLSTDEYIKAVSTSVKAAKIFLKRKPSERRINPYMKGQLSVWRANHDIQFVLDAYACAVYIVDYISKSAKGMSRLMAEACKEAKKGNQTLKESVRHIGNTFLNAAEVSAQEAAYLILQLSLANKSRQCVFIPTAPQSERTFLLKSKKDLEQLPEDSTDIESDNSMKRYARRHDALEDLCLADYMSKFVSCTRHGSQTEPEHSETDETEQAENDSGSESETECVFTSFHYVTKNGMKIKLRSKPRIIRYVRYNEKDDQENFYREQLLLFRPWRQETEDLLAGYDTYMEHYMSVKEEVERKRNEYENNADMLKKIESEMNAHQSEDFDELVPNIESVEANHADEPVELAKPFSFYMPETHEHRHYDLGSDLGVATHIPSDQVEMLQGRLREQEYFMLLKILNKKQREIFSHIMHSLKYKETESLRLFITGGAGVGKSVVIRVLYQALHRHYCSRAGQNPEDIRIAVCAYTGLAAYNVQGSTLHSAFAIEPNKRLEYKQLTDEKKNTLQVKYRHLSVVIIDEISMVGNDMLKFLYHRLQEIKNNYVEPFGGVHMILVGDLFQLRPVADGWIFEDYKRGYNILAPNLWKTYFKMFELDEIMRQKDDKSFAELLNRLREGKQTDADLKELERCSVTKASTVYKQLQTVTHLFATNKDVDDHNAQIFEATQTEKAEINCIDTVKGDCSSVVKEKILCSVKTAKTDKTASLMSTLKVAAGLTYESSHNVLQEDGICNGSPCVLKKIQYLDPNSSTPSCLWVKFYDENTGRQTRTTYKAYYVHGIDKDWTPIWAIKRTFMYSGKAVVRQQFPLKPAAAKTVHKAQGQTKSEVVVDLNSANAHHHYVAYSRVTSMSGLHLLNGIGSKIKVDNRVVSEVERLRTTGKLKLCYRPIYSFENSFKVVFQNIQSMPAHFGLITCDENFTSCDVIALAETNLKTTHKGSDFTIKGFHQILRCDQSISIGERVCHGLAVYVKATHRILSSDYISTSEFECLNINLKSETDICSSVLVIYSKPGCTFTAFKNYVNMTKKFSLFKNLVIVGDFNFDISNSQNQRFLQIMKECFPDTIQIVKTPTTDKKTILDLCFTSYYTAIYEVITCLWSYHHTVGIVIPI